MNRGFTIVETLLFFSISGLIVATVLAGFSSSINNNRRSDTIRSFEAFIEAEYTGVKSGAVVREVKSSGKVDSCNGGGPATDTFPGASDDCLVIGKILKITQGSNSVVEAYNVVADVLPSTTACPDSYSGVMAIVECYNARVIDINATAAAVNSPGWAARLSGISFESKASSGTYRSYDSSEVAHIAILRDPVSELTYISLLEDRSNSNASRYELKDLNDSLLGDYTNTKGQICLKHDGFMAPSIYLRFTGGEGVGAIDIAQDSLAGALTC